MNETQVDTGVAEVSGLALGGRRVLFLDRARIYACGITPYDVTYLGHAATFAWLDVLARTLRRFGVEPEICRNVTAFGVLRVPQRVAYRLGEVAGKPEGEALPLSTGIRKSNCDCACARRAMTNVTAIASGAFPLDDHGLDTATC